MDQNDSEFTPIELELRRHADDRLSRTLRAAAYPFVDNEYQKLLKAVLRLRESLDLPNTADSWQEAMVAASSVEACCGDLWDRMRLELRRAEEQAA